MSDENPFINYKKRDINLPVGCKDLMDVLGMGGIEPGAATKKVSGAFDLQRRIGTLADIETEIAYFFDSAADGKYLTVCSLEQFVSYAGLRKVKGALTVMVTLDAINVVQEQVVRGIFDSVGIFPFTDQKVGGDGSPQKRILRYPLTTSVANSSRLFLELFENAFGLNKEAKLVFFYHERIAMGKSGKK